MRLVVVAVLSLIGLVLLGFSLYYANQGDYPRATFDFVIGAWDLYMAERLASIR